MKGRRDKILDVAVNLAEEGGFDNVRQRDVAAHAGVALGTLYKSFRSKEEILAAALEREAEVLERKMESSPAQGDTPLERAGVFFQAVTRALLRKPNFARAVLRAMTSGEPEVTKNVVAYQGRMYGLIIAALRGVGRLSYSDATMSPPSKRESTVAYFLLQVWFAELVGWSAGLIDEPAIREHMKNAATLVLRGTEGEA